MDVDVNKCHLTCDHGSHEGVVKKLVQYIQQFIKGMRFLDQVTQMSSTSGHGTSLQGKVTTISSFRERAPPWDKVHVVGDFCLSRHILIFCNVFLYVYYHLLP